LNPIPVDPAQLLKDQEHTKQKIIEVTQQLQTVDLTDTKKRVKMMSLDEVQKQIEVNQKQRDAQKSVLDKLLAGIDRLKALLDATPFYEPGGPDLCPSPQST